MGAAEVEPASGPGGSAASRWRRWSWVALLPIAFVVYVTSFSRYSILEARYDVLGDGDSAAFARLITDFSITRTYGDPYAVRGRSVEDVAQKHKVHHLPYVVVASALFTLFNALYALLGLRPGLALYSVNAVIICVNLVLLQLLLRRYNAAGNPLWPFLLFYAFALSTWVFGSVPESWPFSATLVLAFFLGLHSRRIAAPWLAALVGVCMLNNVMLGILVNFIALERAHAEGGINWKLVPRVALYSVIAVATWAVTMTALSPLEPMLRPDHFVHYTLWFRDFTARTLPPWDPYVWKAALSNLFVTAVASNQPDPAVPQDATLLTMRFSRLGLLAVVAYGALVLRAGVRFLRELRQRIRSGERLARALVQPDAWPVVFCVLMGVVTGLLYFSSGFLYSTIVIPLLALALCRYLELRRRSDAALCYVVLALMVINNAVQVMAFARRLAELSSGL